MAPVFFLSYSLKCQTGFLSDDSGVHFAIIKILITKLITTEGKYLWHLGYVFFQ
jgi:hypothetical protein